LPGTNNGAPKIKAISRIGKAAKKLGKERNDFSEAIKIHRSTLDRNREEGMV
jgi:hypothetical protein